MTFKNIYYSFAFLLLLTTQVHANLLVSPIRVVMDEQIRTGEVTLLNTSNTTNSYTVDWIEYRQNQDDSYSVNQNNESPASRVLSYSPRRVTLAPQQSQKIRLRYRASRVEEGEFRSHLRMTALPPEKTEQDTQKTSVSIRLQLSFDLPIIVRKGQGDVSIGLGDIEVVPGIKDNKRSMAKLKIPFLHSGEFSSTGSLRVVMQATPGAEIDQIGIINNLNVFPESPSVIKTIPLTLQDIPAGAAIKVTYEGSKEYKGRLFAEKVFRHEP